jgi:uncharacterized protein DUF1579
MKLAAIAAAALLAAAAWAQSAPPAYGCDSPEAHQFDFWIGEWDLSYVENGKPGTSRNRVSRILDGCAIVEEFSGAPGTPLNGRSVSTFERASGHWKQAWVDNTAAFLDFTGGWDGERMTLAREARVRGRKVMQRMVFRDIRRDRFKWLWQASNDAGRTWTTQWEIDYRRSK